MKILHDINRMLNYPAGKIRMKLHEWNLFRNKKQKSWIKAMSHIHKNEITALETGRIRNPAWKISDGNSTFFLTRQKNIRKLISIDNDTENFSGYKSSQEYCESYLTPKQLQKIEFVNGDSATAISRLPKNTTLDFVLLDSANDPEIILNELKAVEPFLAKPRAVVVVDDVTLPGKKGDLAIPYLIQKGYKENKTSAPPCDCSYFIIDN